MGLHELETLPLTPNGKLDRKALPAPEADAYASHGYEPPQGEIEQKLAAIWAEVLKLERVGRYDNFFSLGGHSLLTIRIVAMLEEIGISILVTDLFAHPPIESLAEYISTKQGSESGIAEIDEAIPIRKAGTELPLFLTHAGEGGLLYLPALSPYIEIEIPVYGLPPTPVNEAPLRTVEGMAARMIKMIRAVQPTGPHRVAGWSFGGTLAYEIATQLIGVDQEVEFLGLIDTYYPPGLDDMSQKPATNYDEKEQILRIIDSEIDPDDDRRLEIDFLRSNLAAMDMTTLLQKLKEMSLLPKEYSAYSVAQIRSWFASAYAMKLAAASYSTWQVPIPVHLFAAQEGGRGNPSNGWSLVVPKNQLRVIPVPGTHLSLMRSPHIETVGRRLSQAIRNAAASSISLPEKTYYPLVTLRAGRSNMMAPLICIPGAGDSITSFIELSTSLDVRSPIYGLLPRGLDGVLVPHSTVSSASEFYLRVVEKINANLPINLLGHSFGGWVAFDMAQRLLESGRNLASLVILDSDAPDTQYTPPREYNQTEVMTRMIDLFEQIIGHHWTSTGITSIRCAKQQRSQC